MIDILWLFIFIPLDYVMARQAKTRHITSATDIIVFVCAIILGSLGIIITIRIVLWGKCAYSLQLQCFH